MLAAVFPGQGSQHIGMGEFLYKNFAEAERLFALASDTLDVDFKKLCFTGPEEQLALTENTQPAILLVSIATLRVLQSLAPVQFVASAGHSIGEYAALVAAGALDFAEALRAVRIRGQAMQSAVPVGQGGMVAVLGMTDEQVNELCHWVESESGIRPLSAANYNSPGQVVISGHQNAIQWLLQQDLRIKYPDIKRLKLIPLKVSAPFHCSLMAPAEEKMSSILNEMPFVDAAYPIIQNVNATPETKASELRKNLILQVSRPVRWVECVNGLQKLGATRCIELGAGKVISGLIKKIDSEHLNTLNITTLDELKAIETILKQERP